jgi:hypothetical protein
MLTREDVERITENILRELTLEMARSDFTDPNRRTIVLKLNGREIDQVSFDVVQQSEYEG